MDSVNASEMGILRHTAKNRRYCGETPEIRTLVNKGLMKSVGRVEWCPDEYFALTERGCDLLRAFNDPAYLKIELESR